MVLYHHLVPEIIKTVRKFILEDDKLQEYARIFRQELDKSLGKETVYDAAIKSYVTHVNKVPSGTEMGKFLALDFCGPVVRVLLLTLQEAECQVAMQAFDVPEKCKSGPSEKLFDFLAGCVSEFVNKMKLKKLQRIPMGVVFGFPIEQFSLQNCKLLRWSKGFNCEDLVGKNVFTKLRDSMRKYSDLKRLFVIGILDQTVSALLTCTVQDAKCKIGMVLGTEANCSYAEKIPHISKYDALSFGEKYMYMNVDPSGFGENGCLDDFRTDFDVQLDQNSANKGKLINEKMTSLTYIGELARLVLIQCAQDKILFDGEITKQLAKKGALNHEHMMRIESDPDKEHTECRNVMEEFGYNNLTDSDCIQIQFICRCISRRVANLIAAQLSAILKKIDEPSVGIALDGEYIKKYPNFEWYLIRKLRQLKKERYEILKPEENGLGRGAGVMAAMFGDEVMDRDEKLRRLPGFPANRCHFRKTGRCLNPNCSAKHPCDTSEVNPLLNPIKTESKDLNPDSCFNDEHCPKKKTCVGFERYFE